jgi:hypothetical protein
VLQAELKEALQYRQEQHMVAVAVHVEHLLKVMQAVAEQVQAVTEQQLHL